MNLILVLASSLPDLSQSNCHRQCRRCLSAEHSWHKELHNCRDNQERRGEKLPAGSGSWHTPIGDRKHRETWESRQTLRLISFSPEKPRTVFPTLAHRAGRQWGEHLAQAVPAAVHPSVRAQEGPSKGCKHSTVSQLQLRDGEDTASGPEPMGPTPRRGLVEILKAKPRWLETSTADRLFVCKPQVPKDPRECSLWRKRI